jgi:hypothetical protein
MKTNYENEYVKKKYKFINENGAGAFIGHVKP